MIDMVKIGKFISDMVKIGKFISQCRKEKGLTQAQLAEKFGITDRAVSKWETGKSIPDASIMLDLCEQLGINVNELLSGEKLNDMTNYNEQAEKNLIALKEKEEQASRNMLSMEVVIGIISTAAFLALLLFGVFAPDLSMAWIGIISTAAFLALLLFGVFAPDLSMAWRIVPCIIGAIIFAVSMHVCIKIEQTAGYYECPHCKHTFVPTLKQTYMSQHMGRTRKMVCPHCHEKGWCKKTLTKKED